MFSTYNENDVILLLKDITGLIPRIGTAEREKLIQQGVHYSEMLPLEYEPSDAYLETFYRGLSLYAKMTSQAVSETARQIRAEKQGEIVLVSLARAGTPIGILLKRFMEKIYQAKTIHYSISIIQGKGIDRNAMDYILSMHKAESIQFVDGWTGKGAIQRELDAAMREYPGVSSGLAVLSDPAGVAEKAGTNDDFLIASACLNATVSGLLSRTFCRKDIIGPQDYHGAAFYSELAGQDLTYRFIDAVEQYFSEGLRPPERRTLAGSGLEEASEILRAFGLPDINFVKPSIGEATRVLLRRMPWKILVHSMDDPEHLGHIYQLAQEKGIALEVYPLRNYRACGLIRHVAGS